MADVEEHMAQTDDMDVSHSKLKNKIDERLLDLFWTLADINENNRASSAFTLITCLKSIDSDPDTDNISHEVTYSLQRLIKGLSSSRKAARLGFYIALVELLKTFNKLKVDDTLTLIKKQLIITGSKQEKGGTVIGLCLAYGALIRSRKIYENKNLLGEITKDLLNLIDEKSYVEVIVGTLIEELFLNVKETTFKKYIFPDLREHLEKGWENCTAFRLWILLLCIKYFPKTLTSDFLLSYWKEPVIICQSNFPEISKIIMHSTWNHPKIHPVCMSLVEAALICNEFSSFWSNVVNDGLLQNQKEKIYLAFELLKEVLPKLSSSEQIKTVLSSQMMREFMQNLAHANMILHNASHLLASSLVLNLKSIEDPSLQFTIVNQLITEPGSILFDKITKTKTVSSMLFHLKADAVKQVSSVLMSYIIGKKIPDEIDSRDADNRRAYAAQLLTHLIKNVNTLKDFDWQTNILQFFCLHAFFNINHKDKVLLQGFKKPKQINGNLHGILKDCFFRLLDSVTKLTITRLYSSLQDHFNMLYAVIEFTNKLLLSASVEPVQKFEDDELEAWNSMLKTVKKLHSRALKDGKDTESQVFQIIFLQMGLQLLANPKQNISVLQELQICCSKALKQRSNILKNTTISDSEENEPHWVEVIVDILISWLSQNRKLLRSFAKSVFNLLQPHLTVTAVCQILDVINPNKATDEDGPLVSDEEPDFTSSSSEDESAGSEEEEKEVNENLKTALRVAMADDENSSEKDVDEMDEQTMIRLDQALSEAFKSQGRKSKKDQAHEKEVLMHFRIRCLDLIEMIIKVRPVLRILSELLIPLVNALDFSIRSKDQQLLYSRTQATLHHLLQIKKKKITVDEFTSKEDAERCLDVLQQLFSKVQRVTNPQVAKIIADCCAFLVSGMRLIELRNKELNKKESKKDYQRLLNGIITLYRENMDKFFMLRNYNLPLILFTSFMKKHPDLAWNFSDLLLNYAFNNEVRLFRKTQALNMLNNSLLKCHEVKQLITEDQWSDFCKVFKQYFTSAVNDLAVSEAIKPLYATELFQLFDVVICYDSSSYKKLEKLPAVDSIKDILPKLPNRTVKKIVQNILKRYNLIEPEVRIQNKKKNSMNTIPVNTTENIQAPVESSKKQSKRTASSERNLEGNNECNNASHVKHSKDENASVRKRKRKFKLEPSDKSMNVSNGLSSLSMHEKCDNSERITTKKKKKKERKYN